MNQDLVAFEQSHPEQVDLHQRLLTLEAQVAHQEARIQALQQECERASVRFELAPTAALVLDESGLIREANALASGWLGLSADRLRRRSFTQLLSPSDRTSFQHLLQEAKRSGNIQTTPLKVGPPAAPVQSLTLYLKAVPTDGPLQDYLVTLVDFSACHAVQLTLLQENEELKQQARASLLTFQTRCAEVDQVIQEMCCEVREANVGIGAVLDQWSGKDLPLEPQLQQARQSLGQSQQAVEAVLNYRRAVRRRICVKPVSLQRVLRDVKRELAPLLHREIEITTDPLPVVQGDAGALKLIFKELLTNALKWTATREVAHIRIRVQQHRDQIHIGIEDNGVGFNMRYREALFQPFRRLQTDPMGAGPGMGLTTARRVGQRFGAQLWAESIREEGATFWLVWPKVPVIE